MVLAGSTPIAGAEVQLYAAGTTGDGSAPVQLLTHALTTDANGAFTVPAGAYSCPLGTSVLYAVASGGSISSTPGTPTPGITVSNSAAELMTVPGICSGVTPNGTYVLNELTTLASVYALRPFLAAGAQLGASATNASGLALGAATVANLVNLTSGTVPGVVFPKTGTAPSPKLKSLANLLDACIVSTGSASGSCSNLFSATQSGGVTPANTLDAALSVANNPGANVATLYSLSTAAAVFAPALAAAPPDWTLPVVFTGGGMNGPSTVAIDGNGLVWVVNYYGAASLFSNTGVPSPPNGFTGYGIDESDGGAIDRENNLWIANAASDGSINGGQGSVTLLNSSGPALPGSSQYSAGGLHNPISVAIDTANNAWVLNYYDNAVTVLNSAGVPLSGPSGFISNQFGFATAIAVDSKRNGWVANFGEETLTEIAPDGSSSTSYVVGNAPYGIAVDANDNVWSANYYDNSVGLVSGGEVLSGGGFMGGGLDHPVGIAPDGNGTVWVTNYFSPGITQLAGASANQPGEAISPGAGWAPDLALVQAKGIAIDAAGNLWVTSYGDNRLIEYVGLAAPVKTPLLGATRIP